LLIFQAITRARTKPSYPLLPTVCADAPLRRDDVQQPPHALDIGVVGEMRRDARENPPLFELALVLVRLDHVAGVIVNPNQGIM
jgi:hypothetical protein